MSEADLSLIDPEEHSYRCLLLQLYGLAVLVSLTQKTESAEISEVKVALYGSLDEMLAKTETAYPGVLSDHFVNCTFETEQGGVREMAGIHLLLSHMG